MPWTVKPRDRIRAVTTEGILGAKVIEPLHHDDQGTSREVFIVYPKDADLATGRVSGDASWH